MTNTNSTFPRTNSTREVQRYLESGEVPIYLIEQSFFTERRETIVEHVKRHFNADAGDCIGIDLIVRDAMQNMALEGRFRITDVRIVESLGPPMLIFRSAEQVDALLRQLEGRALTDEAKKFLATLANDLRLVIARDAPSLEPRTEWVFTFGSHRHPATGECLIKSYVQFSGTRAEARQKMFDAYGKDWCGQYPATGDVVTRNGLQRLTIDRLGRDLTEGGR